MLKFKSVDIYGAKLGNFSRNDKLLTENIEMPVIAEKLWSQVFVLNLMAFSIEII